MLGFTKSSIAYIPLHSVDSFTGIDFPISDTAFIPMLSVVVRPTNDQRAEVGLVNGETKWDMTEREEPPKGRGAFECYAWAR